ncbi:hypothetical protein B0H19DRAFT_1247639 [Mycena capillaripes]|nr:hypothetical protein B0H19DRAFT_1247639 [Mycena capillaripes]
MFRALTLAVLMDIPDTKACFHYNESSVLAEHRLRGIPAWKISLHFWDRNAGSPSPSPRNDQCASLLAAANRARL